MSKKHKKFHQLQVNIPLKPKKVKDPILILEEEIDSLIETLDNDFELIKGKKVPLTDKTINDIKNKLSIKQDKLASLLEQSKTNAN